MRELLLVVKKELTELLRDKKTVFNSILLPTILVPILMLIMITVGKKVEKKNQKKVFSVGLLNAPTSFLEFIKKDTLNRVVNFPAEENFKLLIANNTIQTAIVFSKEWNNTMELMDKGEITVFKNGSKENINRRVRKLLKQYKTELKDQRITALHIPIKKINPFSEKYVEVGEKKEVIGKKIGGFIPYLFILSMWAGCLLASVDLVTGEKERKTIETTLSMPISKFKILLGKTIVASFLGLLPATLNLLGLVAGMKLIKEIPEEFQEALSTMLSFQSIGLIILLMLPFALFVTSVIIAIIVNAVSFKEAQSKAGPLIMLLIIPLVIAMMPGIEFTWSTVFIPVLNMGLGIKEIMAGTIDCYKYTVMLLSLVLFAVSAIYFSYKRFSGENAILS